MLACKYGEWHHGVWVVGDYVDQPNEAMEAASKIADSLREYKLKLGGGLITSPHF